MTPPLREQLPVDRTVEHEHDRGDDPFCHDLRPGTRFNYCGKPYRPWRAHTLFECVESGHAQCPTCIALKCIGHSNN